MVVLKVTLLPVWLQIHRDLLASASDILRLKVCVTIGWLFFS